MSTSNLEISFYLSIVYIILGFVSFVLSGLSLFILWKMKECVDHGGFRFSSVVMLRNLVAADAMRILFLLTGMARFLIIYYTSIGQDPGDPCEPDMYCKIQSFLAIWFNMITIICMLFIGLFAVYQLSYDNKDRYKITDKVLIYVSVGCWILPLLLTLVPALYNVLGEDINVSTNGWCWISSCNRTSKDTRVIFMILYSRGSETVIFVVNITLYIYLKMITKLQERVYKNDSLKQLSLSIISGCISEDAYTNVKNDSKLLFFTNATICFCLLPGIARTVIAIIMTYQDSPTDSFKTTNKVLLHLQVIVDGLQGTLVFGVILLCSKFAKAFLLKSLLKSRQLIFSETANLS